MKLLFTYVKYKMKTICLFILFAAIICGSFALYQLPVSAVIYPVCLCAFTGIIALILGFFSERKKHLFLQSIESMRDEGLMSLPVPTSIISEDYERIIALLRAEAEQETNLRNASYTDMVDYYTVWVHQVKTPIASMKLALQNEDTALSRKLRSDLGRIEDYVNMVLAFIRLESDSSDYVFGEINLDDIIKPALRKFSSDFIGKKLQLNYSPLNKKVVTDEKWLCFIIEQVISNAVKYTDSGSVSISMRDDSTLEIRDTGIGIAPEDLPRIFENGYTGFNGRRNKTASGIGLFLCKKACTGLGHSIRAESVMGEGTGILISFSEKATIYK